jgi:hypothetical protein
MRARSTARLALALSRMALMSFRPAVSALISWSRAWRSRLALSTAVPMLEAICRELPGVRMGPRDRDVNHWFGLAYVYEAFTLRKKKPCFGSSGGGVARNQHKLKSKIGLGNTVSHVRLQASPWPWLCWPCCLLERSTELFRFSARGSTALRWMLHECALMYWDKVLRCGQSLVDRQSSRTK